MTTPTTPNPDSVSEDDLPDNWVEEKEDALKEVLSEMTAVYNEDDEPVDLKFMRQSHADSEGNYIAVNPNLWDEFDPPVEGPNILRVLDEINSHEMGHYNWSDLESKGEFTDLYPGWGQIPGHIANILEDEYVDARKMREFYGLRSKRAYRVKLTMDTEDFAPDISEALEEQGRPHAFLGALHQTALSGTVKGWDDLPDDLQEFCVLAKPVIDRVRRQDDPNERFKLFHVVMQLYQRYIDKEEDFDSREFTESVGMTISGTPSSAPEDMGGDSSLPPAFEEMLEELIEEMAEDGELPFDPEDMEMGVGDGVTFSVPVSESESEEEADGAGGSESGVSLEEDSDDSGAGGGSDGSESAGGSEDGEDEDAPDADGEEEADESESGDEDGDEDGDADGDASEADELDEDGSPPESDIEGGHATHYIDDAAMEEFSARDTEEAVAERYDVNLDSIDKADARDRAKWARLVRSLQDYDLDVEVRKRERDERVEARQGRRDKERLSGALKRRAENAGVIRELEEGFRELVSRNVPQPDRRGSRIDPINVSRRASGDVTMTELFEEEQLVETGDRCVGLATDISGSMGDSIDELKIAGGAIAKATDIIGDEFVWEAFTDNPRHHGSGPEKALDLRIVTGPDEQFDWDHVDSFGSARNEPTAAGIRDCFNLMQLADANQYVMIVITDGIALITEDGRKPRGNEPVEQARQAVNEVRSQGVDVIGLGIGSMSEAKMTETFGAQHYRLTSIDSLADDILDLYREQLDVVKYQ